HRHARWRDPANSRPRDADAEERLRRHGRAFLWREPGATAAATPLEKYGPARRGRLRELTRFLAERTLFSPNGPVCSRWQARVGARAQALARPSSAEPACPAHPSLQTARPPTASTCGLLYSCACGRRSRARVPA